MYDETNPIAPRGKILGGCAGIAALAGIDPLLVRLGAVLAFCAISAKWTLIAYALSVVILRLAGDDRRR